MSGAVPANSRVTVDGKFFRVGAAKLHLKGVTYGPFPPNGDGDLFPEPASARDDLAQIRALGANLLRVYSVPPRWFLDQAAAHGVRLLIDIPWNKHTCFLDDTAQRDAARRAVRDAAVRCARHPATFALSLVNEVPPDIVRWSGAAKIEEFLDELVAVVKSVDPECLCTFGNFPSTEYLRPRDIDFACFNLYLQHPGAFRNYLARLQMLADTQPLLLGEVGLDSLREGEERQAQVLTREIEVAFRAGVAGLCVYSFTDEWFKDGRVVGDWQFGLTRSDRQPKPAFLEVQRAFQSAPRFDLESTPTVSVVVAAYNAARTLRSCLESLQRLDYPACEIVLVDDGSTDETPRIAAGFPGVRVLTHPGNLGLSVARNTGIAAARGEIVAFTDADCRADEDWLRFGVSDLLQSRFAGVGGHNLLPPEDSSVASAVMVSPGGPAHVMLTDRVAEHVPGCNMLFWKWALDEIGGFDPVFRKAGDDVDVCWRLQQRGYQLGFSAASFVWHYRRSTVRDYLKQQHGYGEGEALLERKHPEYFNPLGGSIWRGRIYAPTNAGLLTRRPMIYHGVFGAGLFQSLYTSSPSFALMLLTSLEYYVLVVLPLLVLATVFPSLTPVAVVSVLVSLGVCVLAAAQADLPRRKRRWWSRPLVALLFALQPLVRGWARYQGRLVLHHVNLNAFESLDSLSREQTGQVPRQLRFWAPAGFHRGDFLAHLLARLDARGWFHRADSGWSNFDVEIFGGRWARLHLTTAGEYSATGENLIRCRLRPAWTLPARTACGLLLGLDLLCVGLLRDQSPWWWLVLLSLPALAWWFHRQERALSRLVGTFLDQMAEELGLSRIGDSAPQPRASNPTTAPRHVPPAGTERVLRPSS